MDKKYKKEKRVFEKHKQKLYKNEKEIYSFFQDKSFGKKSPCGTPHGQKKKFLKKHKQGGHEKGLRKRDRKKWPWMVSLYRPWQDPIGQGHGEWNGNRERLYGMAMGLPGKGQNSQK